MSRLLFVVPPLAGHINPLAGAAAELAAGGHRVAWAGPHPLVGELLGEDALVYPAGDAADFDLSGRPPGLRAFAALKFLWENYLVPLADAMVAGVGAAVTDFAPDVIVVDQQALAGALVATRAGLPWATSATTSSELADPLGTMPKVASWIRDLQQGLRDRHGVAGEVDLRFSPHAVLAFSTEELAGCPVVPLPGELHYVGPSLADRRETAEFPWHRIDPDRSLVLVTLGTANGAAGGRFLAESARALANLRDDFQGVIVDPEGSLPEGMAEDVLVARGIPQLSVIQRAAVVVCHGGHNTVCETLWHGVPLVVAPIRDDQPVLAQQVVNAGAGTRIRFDRARAEDIEQAIRTVCQEPDYAAQARRIRTSFRHAGGSTAAARHLSTLASISTAGCCS
ncbi:glycosyltransferase [Amycolatopsis cihanbeyliensis]|uniref:MGT family glycosyltransferase n=1 Tax=Amycolatopsis cihanbeyliensis TaxID=1128664 RepID=A0A542DR04_AMYCI|nr:nucleotide disphospho-sugar-binding domain-containing protein [Amycolatopsis cihanbeyliensis]TQJ05530.1 MGT family glycosyltransferase [Amycolatopsis cihanbeyliensis]